MYRGFRRVLAFVVAIALYGMATETMKQCQGAIEITPTPTTTQAVLANNTVPPYDPYASEKETASTDMTQWAREMTYDVQSPDYCAEKDINIRKGPGTNYSVVGSLSNGDCGKALGTNSDGTWLNIGINQWVRADLVKVYTSSLPVIDTVVLTSRPIITSKPIATTKPIAKATKAPPVAVCSCSSNAYDCANFNNRASAQACYDYCFATVHYDVHWLDADGDGRACE